MNRKKVLKVLGFAALFIVLLFAILVIFSITKSSSVNKRITAYEAARQIPDTENAAIIYERLLNDSNFTNIFENDVFKQMTKGGNFSRPWKSSDFLEEAGFIEKNKIFFSQLQEAAKREKCVFKIPVDIKQPVSDDLSQFRNWAQFLRFSANNDIAEGRFDEAMEKNRLIIKLSDHIQRQPITTYFLVGVAIEAISLQCMKNTIMEPNLTEQQLQTIEKLPVKTGDDWEKIIGVLIEGEGYYAENIIQNYPFLTRLVLRMSFKTMSKITVDSVKKLYYRSLADRYGYRIMIGLRKYKNQNGQWPDNLEQIKSFVDPNIMVDPQNSGAFVYKKTDNDFILYSRGPNNIDEQGNSTSPADDWPIWPKP